MTTRRKTIGVTPPGRAKFQIPCEVDWTGVGLDEAIELGMRDTSWSVSLRRVLKTKTDSQLTQLAKDGLKIHIRDCGKATPQSLNEDMIFEHLIRKGHDKETARIMAKAIFEDPEVI